MTFKLIQATDQWMTRPQFFLPRGQHFYPSESSVKWTDHHGIERVSGACIRQVYYRLTSSGVSSGTSAYTEWIFALGKAVEEILVEQWKQMGILVANNVKFYDELRNISGEVDVILREPDTGKLFCGEVKSFYAYQATKEIVGNKGQKGKPKTSQLLQSLIYVDLGNRLNLFDYVKMIYYARDSAARKEFDITLKKEGNKNWPVIDGITDYRFTMEDIYSRFVEVDNAVRSGQVPSRDYDAYYSPEKVKERYSIGDVSKSAYDKWIKNPSQEPVGDWMCNYCKYKTHCYSST